MLYNPVHFGKYIEPCIHYQNYETKQFYHKKFPCAAFLESSLTSSDLPQKTWYDLCSYSFGLSPRMSQQCNYTACSFCTKVHLRCAHVAAYKKNSLFFFFFFFLLSSIPFHGYSTFSLSIQLNDICIVSTFWWLWIKLIYRSLCKYKFKFFLVNN